MAKMKDGVSIMMVILHIRRFLLESIQCKAGALSFTFILGFCMLMGTEVISQESACEDYRLGDITKRQIAVFLSLDDMSDGVPTELRDFYLRKEYIKQPHIRGYFGQYPPPDYDLSIRFQMNIDTGQPVPQRSPSYARKNRTNRDFIISISATWVPVEEYLPSQAALPVDGSIDFEDYEVVGEKYGMLEVSYLSALEEKGAGDYALRRSKEANIFLERHMQAVHAFMKCKKVTNVVRVPHCGYCQVIDGFIVETYFKKSLIDDLDTIKRRTVDFVTCLFVEG